MRLSMLVLASLLIAVGASATAAAVVGVGSCSPPPGALVYSTQSYSLVPPSVSVGVGSSGVACYTVSAGL